MTVCACLKAERKVIRKGIKKMDQLKHSIGDPSPKTRGEKEVQGRRSGGVSASVARVSIYIFIYIFHPFYIT